MRLRVMASRVSDEGQPPRFHAHNDNNSRHGSYHKVIRKKGGGGIPVIWGELTQLKEVTSSSYS